MSPDGNGSSSDEDPCRKRGGKKGMLSTIILIVIIVLIVMVLLGPRVDRVSKKIELHRDLSFKKALLERPEAKHQSFAACGKNSSDQVIRHFNLTHGSKSEEQYRILVASGGEVIDGGDSSSGEECSDASADVESERYDVSVDNEGTGYVVAGYLKQSCKVENCSSGDSSGEKEKSVAGTEHVGKDVYADAETETVDYKRFDFLSGGKNSTSCSFVWNGRTVFGKFVNEKDNCFLFKREVEGFEICSKVSGLARMVFWKFDIEGRPLIAFEHIDGVTLDKANFLELEELPTVLLSVAQTLVEMHNLGVFHCDLKGSNIMIGHDRKTTVVDLGSCLFSRSIGKGKLPLYTTEELMPPPKRDESSPEKYVRAIDSWQFGLLLLALLGKKVKEELEFEKWGRLSECLNQDYKKRPSMAEIVGILEEMVNEKNL